MIIKAAYIGNDKLAFMENHFEDGINLIYSDDNNKGKTILIQAIGYALGNKALFPKGFDYQNHYYIVDFEVNNTIISILRKDDTFLIKKEGAVYTFSSQSEMKKWFDKEIFNFPKIIKNDRIIIIDFELFLESFFLGQDKRDTSKTASSYFNKNDYLSMLHYICGVSNVEINNEYLEIKQKLDKCIEEQKQLLKKTKLIKKMTTEAKNVSTFSDREEFKKLQQSLDELNKEITNLKNLRNRVYNRYSKNITLETELNSLNKTIAEGKLICLECNSDKIIYSYNSNIKFDVSTREMRSDILRNLKMQNESYLEEIEKIDNDIARYQEKSSDILKLPIMNSVNLILYKNDLIEDLKLDEDLVNKDKEIQDLKEKYLTYSLNFDNNKLEQKRIEKELKAEMNTLYNHFDNSDIEQIEELFTKSTELYSGSENTTFFISRLISILKTSKHNYPLIIDGFREGEVSTPTEKKLMDIFKSLSNQIILTATLKDEEFHKYDKDELINRIDYSDIISKHLLQQKYVKDIISKLKEFNVSI